MKDFKISDLGVVYVIDGRCPYCNQFVSIEIDEPDEGECGVGECPICLDEFYVDVDDYFYGDA